MDKCVSVYKCANDAVLISINYHQTINFLFLLFWNFWFLVCFEYHHLLLFFLFDSGY